jgi:hypothetical protein
VLRLGICAGALSAIALVIVACGNSSESSEEASSPDATFSESDAFGSASDAATSAADGGTDAAAAEDGGVKDAGPDVFGIPCTFTATVLAGDATQAFSDPPADGTGSAARFRSILALRVDPTTGDLIVYGEQRIRRVTTAGVVTTLAPKISAPGYANLAVDSQGAVYYVDNLMQLHTIPKGGADQVVAITASGRPYSFYSINVSPSDVLVATAVELLADGGRPTSVLSAPRSGGTWSTLIALPDNHVFTDLAFDATGAAYIADPNSRTMFRVGTGAAADGGATVLDAGSNTPLGIAASSTGTVFAGRNVYRFDRTPPPLSLPEDAGVSAYGRVVGADGAFYAAWGTYYNAGGWSHQIQKFSGCPIP